MVIHASASQGDAESQPGFKQGLFGSIAKSLSDYGIGKKSIWEGGVGLFVLAGGGAAVALVAWARGNALRTGTPYQATIEFPLACGIQIGTPVRIRGVQVNDVSTVIPRNSVIEANQSGLIAEPLVPVPDYRALPHEPRCQDESLIGVALDDLVYIMTRCELCECAENDGVDKVFAAAESATQLMEKAAPLVSSAAELVGNIEALTRTAADAAADIRRLQGSVLTEDNVRALRQAVLTLCKTLDHVESISADVSILARDSGVQRNLKTLVQALSRLLDD
eukprot:XP_001699315.1 permease-like component of an ABC transporter [Chlamydomonas reinhardtii]